MAPRWKWKGAEAKARADPMSDIISQLRFALTRSDAGGLLSANHVLISLGSKDAELLNCACFGQPIFTAKQDTVNHDQNWFQLGLEEAFYLCHAQKCLKVTGDNNSVKSEVELWQCMRSRHQNFPSLYKAYSHLRKKNWVVRPGFQYGADFVAYRHHPSLVHSEYAILVLSDGCDKANGRLGVWSDIYSAIRVSASVAKTLLVIHIDKNGCSGALFPSCLEKYSVEEHVIRRWSPGLACKNHSNNEDAVEKFDRILHLI